MKRQKLVVLACAIILSGMAGCASTSSPEAASPSISTPATPEAASPTNLAWEACYQAVTDPLIKIMSLVQAGEDASTDEELNRAATELGLKSPEIKIVESGLSVFGAAMSADKKLPQKFALDAAWLLCEKEYGKSGLPNSPDPGPIAALNDQEQAAAKKELVDKCVRVAIEWATRAHEVRNSPPEFKVVVEQMHAALGKGPVVNVAAGLYTGFGDLDPDGFREEIAVAAPKSCKSQLRFAGQL